MNKRSRNLLVAFGLCLFVVGFCAVEDWYGETIYGADGISYFENARAICEGDWSLALNPYWSIGYPLVLAAARWMFPAGSAGEWTSIHVVNLVLFVATYVSFIYFVRVAIAYATRVCGGNEILPATGSILVVGSLIFLEWQVQNKDISRTTPDLMISGLFFLLTAGSLQFCLRPGAKFAILMGVVTGLGYIAKAIFLPLSFVVFAAVVLQLLTRPNTNRVSTIGKLAWAIPTIALVAGPYIIAISIVLGHFTLGESGSLNYAWTVNGLTHWHWTEGTAAYGNPIHPVRLLCASPHVYGFGEPIHVTYPPFYNPYYWYEGYHHFFSLKNQLAVIKPNLFLFTVIFFNTPHAPVKAVVTLVLLLGAVFLFTNAKLFWQRLKALWLIYVPALLGVGIYLLVCMETRYILGFIIVLMVTPLLVIFVPTPLVDKKIGRVILILIALVSLTFLISDTRHLLGHALRNDPYTRDKEWQTGFYLTAQGVAPGTRVAMVRVEHGIQTTWAYVSGVHVVGQIGNQDFKEAQQQKDFRLFLDSVGVQQTVFDLFRKAGAVLVVTLDAPHPPQGEGWVQVPGTQSWVHWL